MLLYLFKYVFLCLEYLKLWFNKLFRQAIIKVWSTFKKAKQKGRKTALKSVSYTHLDVYKRQAMLLRQQIRLIIIRCQHSISFVRKKLQGTMAL